MKASELRIGNYVYFNDQLEQIDLDSFHGIGTFYCINSYSAIPLTEEWLVKFGLSSSFTSNPQNFPASKQFEYKGFKVHQPIEDVDQFIFEPIIDDYIEIKHVHQLQNLYFALTGQELELK
jgi:hypothetical protein